MITLKRLQKELHDINKSQNPYFAVEASNDLMFWKATIKGPENTFYSNQIYHLTITIPNNYPFSAPKVRFMQPCYHPNISSRGDICLDIISKKQKWSPLQNITSVLLSIISFLSDPNPADPFNLEAARTYHKDKTKFAEIVKITYLCQNPKVFDSYPVITKE
jgi:ubiquitin-conjugating enzyme E2 D